jgi:CRP/FNR family transcriptional regulator, cyclic AMP receptor protein
MESGARQEIVKLLGGIPLFSELSPEDLDDVAQLTIPRTFPRETRVFHEGDPGDACYIVSRGSCRVTRQHSDGRVITLATLGRGAIFGELAMFDGERRSASVEAAENTELLALPATDMRNLIRSHPEMAEKLVIALTRRLRAANERISHQSFQTVPSRVAGVLNQLLAEAAVTPLVKDGVTIRLRQSDLAQMAGTSRESVSRFLATLERAGVVQVGRGRVTVIAPERLDAYIF